MDTIEVKITFEAIALPEGASCVLGMLNQKIGETGERSEFMQYSNLQIVTGLPAELKSRIEKR